MGNDDLGRDPKMGERDRVYEMRGGGEERTGEVGEPGVAEKADLDLNDGCCWFLVFCACANRRVEGYGPQGKRGRGGRM